MVHSQLIFKFSCGRFSLFLQLDMIQKVMGWDMKNITFSSIILLSSCACILPLFLKNGITGLQFDSQIDVLYNNIQTFLACSMAASLPSIFLIALENVIKRFWKISTLESKVSGIVLTLSLFLPNVLIISCAIRFKSPEAVISLVHIRYIMYIHGAMSHIKESSYKMFRSDILGVIIISLTLNRVFINYYFYYTSSQILLFISVSLQGIGFICLLHQSSFWRKSLKMRSILSLDDAEIIATFFLTFSVIHTFIMLLSTMGFGLGPSFIPKYLLIGIVLDGLFGLFLIIIQYLVFLSQFHKLERMLELKRVFVRSASHEIRTPLNTVLVGMDVIKDSLLRSQASIDALETVDDVRNSVEVAVEILSDLLHYEKLSAGIMTLELADVVAWTFLSSVILPFTVQSSYKGIDLKFPDLNSMEAELLGHIVINIDRHRMSQVFRNIISNAIKFTPSGGIITIKTKLTQQTVDSNEINSQKVKGFLRVEVIDSGAGISQENLPKVFNEVIQFDAGKLQNGGGSGLGLWISKGIMDLHQGRIAVSSLGVGRGCTFTVDIPVTDDSLAISRISSPFPQHPASHHEIALDDSVLREFPVSPRSYQQKDFDDSANLDYVKSCSTYSKLSRKIKPKTQEISTKEYRSWRVISSTDFHEVCHSTASSLMRYQEDSERFSVELHHQQQQQQQPSNEEIQQKLQGDGGDGDGNDGEGGDLNSHSTGVISRPLNTSSPVIQYSVKTQPSIKLSASTKSPKSKKRSKTLMPQIENEKIESLFSKVLIVDDAAMNRKMLKRALHLMNYKSVDEACDGREAVNMISSRIDSEDCFNLVLMDSHMPHLDGPHAALEIRTMGYQGIIIGVTGNAHEEDIQKFMSCGVNGILIKPVDVKMLRDMILDFTRRTE